jgi:hypothetical protein
MLLCCKRPPHASRQYAYAKGLMREAAQAHSRACGMPGQYQHQSSIPSQALTFGATRHAYQYAPTATPTEQQSADERSGSAVGAQVPIKITRIHTLTHNHILTSVIYESSKDALHLQGGGDTALPGYGGRGMRQASRCASQSTSSPPARCTVLPNNTTSPIAGQTHTPDSCAPTSTNQLIINVGNI